MNSLIEAETLFAQRQDVEKDLSMATNAHESLLVQETINKQAHSLFQTASERVQTCLKEALTSLCTSALHDVFGNKRLRFGVEFVPQKHTTNIQFYIEEDGMRYDPLESRGHGIADLLSFVLRVSILYLLSDREKILMLDEPFTRISEEYRDGALAFISNLSKQLGLQIILVTHMPELAAMADRIFYVSQIGGNSVVKAKGGKDG